jgi:hypothetical protein
MKEVVLRIKTDSDDRSAMLCYKTNSLIIVITKVQHSNISEIDQAPRFLKSAGPTLILSKHLLSYFDLLINATLN